MYVITNKLFFRTGKAIQWLSAVYFEGHRSGREEIFSYTFRTYAFLKENFGSGRKSVGRNEKRFFLLPRKINTKFDLFISTK
jgi:hypothetical protein